jgi:hypothetical protein
MKKLISAVLLISLSLLIFVSCSNEDSGGGQYAKLQVRLTDDPADYDAVNIDIQDVQINLTGDSAGGWQSLSNVSKGVYNLLDLVNDKDTLLADADIQTGRMHQLRLVLGPNNTIVVDGVTHPLETPSSQQSGLKLNFQQDVTAGILYTILLDFEAARSIVKTGNDKFVLKPVIRAIFEPVGGSISGYVDPAAIKTAVYALQGTDTASSTFTDAQGGYLVRGLSAGTYDLYFLPLDATYQESTKNGVIVTTGNVTKVDTVRLQH